MSSVFTKIINGELPGRFIYRDDTVAAFLDIEPLTYGHTLIVPVQEVDKWTDLAPNVWCEVNEAAQSIGRAVMEAFDAKRAGYVIASAKSNPLDQTLRFTVSFDMDGIKDLFKR